MTTCGEGACGRRGGSGRGADGAGDDGNRRVIGTAKCLETEGGREDHFLFISYDVALKINKRTSWKWDVFFGKLSGWWEKGTKEEDLEKRFFLDRLQRYPII